MLFFRFECVPDEAADAAGEGAYVNCWIARRDQDEADRFAREVIAEQGWLVARLNEACSITREDYADGHSPEGLDYHEQAETDGQCFVFYTYPEGSAE